MLVIVGVAVDVLVGSGVLVLVFWGVFVGITVASELHPDNKIKRVNDKKTIFL